MDQRFIAHTGLAWLLLLAGCTPDFSHPPYMHLIDQRDFQASGQAPAAADLARAALPPLPLVVIRFDNPDADFRVDLANAVNDAVTRKADVQFDVLTPVPLSAPQEAQAQATRQGSADAQLVATALAADGIVPDRVHIGLRGDAGAPPREVLVYAR
jgi:hypothetical protein